MGNSVNILVVRGTDNLILTVSRVPVAGEFLRWNGDVYRATTIVHTPNNPSYSAEVHVSVQAKN
jgi:hypothetical protein